MEYSLVLEVLDLTIKITAAMIAIHVLTIFWYLDKRNVILSRSFLEYEKSARYEFFKRAIAALTFTILVNFLFKLSYFFNYPRILGDSLLVMEDVGLIFFGYFVFRSLRYTRRKFEAKTARSVRPGIAA